MNLGLEREIFSKNEHFETTISVVCYACAIIMMVIYYTVFHPSKLTQSKNEIKSPLPIETVQIVETYQPLPRFQHLER